MKESRKRYWYEMALCASFVQLIYSPIIHTAELEEEQALASMHSLEEEQVLAVHFKADVDVDTYTVNFNNIAIIELIRFASKITNLNFIFNDAELQFTVTVVSEEPVTAKNIMAVVSQVLRMHDLVILEQDGNVLITRSTTVNQIAPIVSSDIPDSKAGNSALVTRIFRIKNANVNSIASIIRPMTSAGALIEVSMETRQLIVTDITPNVDQIASLLTSLDAPHSPLDIEAYTLKNIAALDLIALTEKILTPFTEGNPLIFVPQAETNSIYIVSTPHLIERAMTIMEDLDVPAKASISKATFVGKTVYIYKALNHSADELRSELTQIADQLKSFGGAPSSLQTAIEEAQVIRDKESLLFVVDSETQIKLKDILTSLDTPTMNKTSQVFLYKLKYADCTAVIEELRDIARKMPANSLQNKNVIDSIKKIECIKVNNSLLITGAPETIDQLKIMIGGFDMPGGIGSQVNPNAFLIYKPKFLPPTVIEAAIIELANDLHASGLNDPELFHALDTMQFVTQTNSLLFTGSQEGLDKVQNLLNNTDTSAALGSIQSIGNITFFIYKIQSASPDQLMSTLKSFASNLKQSNIEDKQIAAAIDSVKLIKETNSLLFTGNSKELERIEQIVKKFDIPGLGGPSRIERAANNFVIYNPKYIRGEELINILCDFMQNLMTSGVADPGLFDTINTLKWIDKTSSLLISGDKASIDKVEQLLAKFDIPNKDSAAPSIESIDNVSFLVYKLQFHPGDDIQNALKQVATSLEKGSNAPKALYEAINSLQWIQVTNSLLCSGPQDVLVKLKDLIQNLDIPLKQVFIEVLVITTTLNNAQNFGLTWGGQVQYFNKTVLQTGNFPLNPSVASPNNPAFTNSLQSINSSTTPKGGMIPFTSGFDLGVIGDIIMHKGRSFISLGSLLNAIQTDSDSTIILNPKIITQDNRQSTVFVGQNVPYTGSLVTSTTSTQTQTANIEYRDVGVSLTITPILGDGDVITMDIVQDISQILGNQLVTTSASNVNGIQTSHTHMETRVHVPDNHFVALSGMISDTKSHVKTSIPCLGGLPVIGALFSENDRSAAKTNIIVFVRPQIVKNAQMYKTITEHQEWLYKDDARLPILKEQFDEGIDMVKIPENE